MPVVGLARGFVAGEVVGDAVSDCREVPTRLASRGGGVELALDGVAELCEAQA